MLPFSTYEFFLVMGAFIGVLLLCKLWLQDTSYKYVLALLNLLFLAVFFPQPWHFFGLIIYSYFFLYLFSSVLKPKLKIWGIIVLLLPMLLVKFEIQIASYPFKINNLLSFAGLSYASFRIVGYYMDKAPTEKMANPVTYFNFLSFTPTLLIGPIERYGRFQAAEATGFSTLTSEHFIKGWNALLKGLVFKYICAEVVDRYWLCGLEGTAYSGLSHLNDYYAYYFYLFFDFAGYSFMALGIGYMMGMQVPVNFTNPFVAVNPQDFWRRFHISLGDWLKDYFFTPLYLFLTRKKRLKKYPITRQNTALLLTFTLMGCWNGFTSNFVLSGLLFGSYSLIHNTYVIQCKKKNKDVVFGNMNPKLVRLISIFVTFHLTAFALFVFSGRY